jgi:hypothetical protein
MTKCHDCGQEGAHYLSRRDAEMRCWKCNRDRTQYNLFKKQTSSRMS